MQTQHASNTENIKTKQFVQGYYRNSDETPEEIRETFVSKLIVFSFATGALAVVWHLAPQALATSAGIALAVWIAKRWNEGREVWKEDYTNLDTDKYPKRHYKRPSDALWITEEGEDGQRYDTKYWTNPVTGITTPVKRRKHKVRKEECYV